MVWWGPAGRGSRGQSWDVIGVSSLQSDLSVQVQWAAEGTVLIAGCSSEVLHLLFQVIGETEQRCQETIDRAGQERSWAATLPGNGKALRMNHARAVTSPGAGCLIQASDSLLQSTRALFLTSTGNAIYMGTGKFLAEGNPPWGQDHEVVSGHTVTRSALPRYS